MPIYTKRLFMTRAHADFLRLALILASASIALIYVLVEESSRTMAATLPSAPSLSQQRCELLVELAEVEWDKAKSAKAAAAAERECTKAAQEEPSPVVLDHLGVALKKDGHPMDAWRNFKTAAEAGLVVGERHFAECLEVGAGGPKDEPMALDWYLKASAQNDAASQERLGVYLKYAKGGITKDPVAAFAWFQKAAMQGAATAMNFLAFSYMDGTGVAKDEARGKVWLRKSLSFQEVDRARARELEGFLAGLDKDAARAHTSR